MRWTGGLAGALVGSLAYHAMPGLASVADVDPAEVASSASQTSDAASLKAALLAGNFTSPISHAVRSRCPLSCSESGLDSTAWSVYHRVDRLDLCDSPMLLDFNLFNKLDDPRTHLSIAACTADLKLSSSSKRETTDISCLSDSVTRSTDTSLELATSGTTSSTKTTDVVDLLDQLQSAFALSESACKEDIQIAYTDKAAIGVYLGSALSSQGVISPVLKKLATQVQTDGSIAQETFVQLCDSSTARYSLGVYVSTTGDLPSVQQALQTWHNSSCLATKDATADWYSISYLAPSSHQNSTLASNSTSLAARELSRRRANADQQLHHGYMHSHLHKARDARRLRSRDDSDECTTIQVVSGDTCTTLADECGITAAEFTEYNSDSDLCSTLLAGQHVCCTDGDLPDYAPSPDLDGNCYSYTVKTNDTCLYLAAAYDITVDEVEAWNTGSNGTWGWMGCSDLLIGSYMCLSEGYPPMPANVPSAVCGPQVNDTATAPHGTDLSTLNECPLNACCDIWGQCGITADFCTPSNSTTGNPGTAAEGENGCISNCGTEIVVSDAPASTYSIAYFEASDQNRSCLTMSVDQVDTSVYTHIHFAFATINTDMSISVDGMEDQLSLLSDMTGVKRILSIGGWDFSTNTGTYMIFRDAVTSTNRATLVSNIVDFLDEYDLDGVDFDWEYPDEPDIPGIPAGTTADSTNYYLTLVAMKEALSSEKTVSVTAPASFWYLECFPIEAIGSIVDYIVYMTYDLHGQWDYDNAYVDSGCDDGNCLRSHVNITETLSSLSMITKAGVSSNKVAVGVASYARSFEMTEAGCWTSMCTYTGPDSGAWPGPCTDTAGYIANYELELVIAENPTAELYWDKDSYSNILVFNETQWAGYMNDTNKAVRIALYESLAFLGSADWAVDLQSEDGNEDNDGSGVIYIDPTVFSEPSPTVAGYPPFTMVWPTSTLATPIVVNFPPYPWVDIEGVITENTMTSTTSASGNVTFTWSEQQIDSLATISTTTTITTTTTHDSSSTIIILPINTGGFYWSPVPLPDIPLPTINLPELPPIPTLECFTLFGIFTIDCPPNEDKSKKTTHYTSAKESPTCSPSTAASCGKLCTTNCDASSTSTDESTTTTTTCTSEKTSSCSTTSSMTVTGCSVTATTTTTGVYCAATPAAVWSTDDQGENGAEYMTTTTTSVPEEVVASGTTYLVGAGGAITLGDGDVITVPTDPGATTVMTIDGETVTVNPAVEMTVTVVSIDSTDTTSTTESTATNPFSVSTTKKSTTTTTSETYTETTTTKATTTSTETTTTATTTTAATTTTSSVSSECVGGDFSTCITELEGRCSGECATWPFTVRNECITQCINTAFGTCYDNC
ncbi:hypothetical protein BDW59DRAFT_178921 [Aspergillus cavernicola]|uniref:chitinase n=1 Tax=Aspergillus cavernicola TaxID=176166 RepID=A0ABR4IJM0_9EURO